MGAVRILRDAPRSSSQSRGHPAQQKDGRVVPFNNGGTPVRSFFLSCDGRACAHRRTPRLLRGEGPRKGTTGGSDGAREGISFPTESLFGDVPDLDVRKAINLAVNRVEWKENGPSCEGKCVW